MSHFFHPAILEEYNHHIRSFETEIVMAIDRVITRAVYDTISKTCLEQIGQQYLEETLNDSLIFRENEKYYKIQKKYDIVLLIKRGNIGGFMVIKKGLCRRMPDLYGVSLVCSSQKGGGSLLIGLYLYAILSHPEIPQIGLLELAAAYNNVPGLCLYEKFGFRQDVDLFGPTCFDDPFNLPMSVDLNTYYLGSTADEKKARLVEIVLGKRMAKTPFCSLQGERQDSLALVKNVLLLMQYPYSQRSIIQDINRTYQNLYDNILYNLTEKYEEDADFHDVKDFLYEYMEILEKGEFYEENKEDYEMIMRDPSRSVPASLNQRGKTWKHLKHLKAKKRASVRKGGRKRVSKTLYSRRGRNV